MLNRLRILVAATTFGLSLAAHAAAEPGQPAPDFTLANLAGEKVALSSFKGKTVVLEWNNPNCPFVRKHYGTDNMQRLQHDKGAVVWLTVNSTNPANPDFMDAGALRKWVADMKAAPSHYLLDADGAVGRAYGAKTTPHMFIVDAKGTVVYAGAIDDKRSTNPDDVPMAHNYVKAGLDALAKGQPVAAPATAPYGCSVKY